MTIFIAQILNVRNVLRKGEISGENLFYLLTTQQFLFLDFALYIAKSTFFMS